jgi:endonuclease/exonuclease/phosphatase (EEP) superfamily protein YafD
MLSRVRLPVPHLVAWLLVAPFVLWVIFRVARIDRFGVTAQLMAFTPYVALASLVPVALALLGRRWWVAGVAGAVCLALAVCVLPRSFGSPSTMDGVPVTVMSMNLRYGGADVDTIMRLVTEQRVDVLAVQEYTEAGQNRLAAVGLDDLLPYQVKHPVDGPNGSALYSRYPLTDTGVVHNLGGFFQAYGVVAVPGAVPVAVESAHPVPPISPYIPYWVQDLRDQKPASTGPHPRILIGDFNSTLDHSLLRDLIATGYHDAASTVGHGLVPTWPYDGGRASVTPKITIDHILCGTGIGVTDFHAFTVPTTDHRAIIARLLLPRR